jgi:hypothetical protein
MPIIKEIPIRKTVMKQNIVIEDKNKYDNLILFEKNYTTNGEDLIIVKTIGGSEILLNSETTNRVIIKSLVSVLVKPNTGKIDEEWDELLLEKGACVQFQFVQGNWYVLSSDGIKIT